MNFVSFGRKFWTTLSLLLALAQLRAAEPAAAAGGADWSPSSILALMKKVADWQLAQPPIRPATNDWTYAAFYAGVMALARTSGDAKYHDAMVTMGRQQEWQPAKRIFDADDHCITQTYLELFLRDHDATMLAPTKERFDYILANPRTNDLHFPTNGNNKVVRERWSWCDSLFMGPPAWVRLYKATGDQKYLDFMDREWAATSEFLYDKSEHLYFRDSTYFERREANGKKVFWSRGNGWVLAGLARVLEYLPPEHTRRNFYEHQFKEIAERIAALQQSDGLWHPSLLDPESYPLKETSGSSFYVFGLGWGINHGLLARAKYEPIVRKGWQALVECVTPEGNLEHVQPIGADPKKFDPMHSDVFGVGAFLLAGSEVFKLANTAKN
jgi:unsaturated rhamnogalacturonyl hydrolase